MKTMEIYYRDLCERARIEFDETFGTPENFNHDICPLAIYEVELEDENDEAI